MESWREAWGPALRAFGYFSAFFLLYYVLGVAFAFTGLSILIWIISFLAPVYLVFAVFLSIFKVLQEQKPPGVVQLL